MKLGFLRNAADAVSYWSMMAREKKYKNWQIISEKSPSVEKLYFSFFEGNKWFSSMTLPSIDCNSRPDHPQIF